ncbi:MAG: GTPase ObgE [Acidobacteria bacterium]|jgi:GTP-binding protein|nr:GTPase ObgE [Acidobacteriota bacterium]
MFVDSAIVKFIAGNGGNGCVSFRREKYIPKGGPDGGNGGNGGSIILLSGNTTNSLIDFKFKKIIKAQKGANGKGANKTGKDGDDIIITVPAGTVIKSYPDEKILFDFPVHGLSFTVVKGGRGGKGNAHFKSSTHQTPKFAQPGAKGETLDVILELKLIAFAGLVGFPNAGKSTLISKISGAKPKIADYPFTTLVPHLGVVYNENDSLVVADIPGIIEGAHLGEGMGLQFLKHVERTKVLLFLLDVSPYAEMPPLDALDVLQEELKSYNANLLVKDYLVVANKIDLLEPATENPALVHLKKFCQKKKISYIEISALKEINLKQLKNKLFELHRIHQVHQVNQAPVIREGAPHANNNPANV